MAGLHRCSDLSPSLSRPPCRWDMLLPDIILMSWQRHLRYSDNMHLMCLFPWMHARLLIEPQSLRGQTAYILLVLLAFHVQGISRMSKSSHKDCKAAGDTARVTAALDGTCPSCSLNCLANRAYADYSAGRDRDTAARGDIGLTKLLHLSATWHKLNWVVRP